MKEPAKSKERVLKAINHQNTDRVPCDYLATLEVDRKLRDYFGFCSKGRIEVEEGIDRWNRARGEAMEEVLKRLGVDIRQVNPVGRPFVEKFSDGSWKDIWGVTFHNVSNEFGVYAESISLPLAKLKSLDDVKNYPWPNPDWYDYASICEQCAYYSDYAIKAGGPGVPDLLNGVSRGRGMEQVMMDIALEDPVGLAILDRRFAFYREFARRTLEAAKGKVDIFWIGDDYGTQRGLLMNPNAWRKILKPYLRQMIDLIHGFNAKAMLHSCGSTALIWDDFAELGLDIYQTIQERATGMNPELLKLQYGDRICLHGAIDSQGFLQTACPDEVKKVVRARINRLGRDGGYICASSHNLQPDIPVENIIAMYQAINGA